MRKISFWAKDHKWSSRFIIVTSFIVLNILGIVTGKLLGSLEITIPVSVLFFVAGLYCVGFIAYPSRSLKGQKLTAAAFYVRQKSCDLMLVASTFCMIVYFSNRPGEIFNYTTDLNAAIASGSSFPKDSAVFTPKTIAAFAASLKNETGKSLKWKEKRSLLKAQIRAIKKDREMPSGAKVGLIILSVLVALGLIYAIAALACTLSCGGSEGAAVLVMVGGAGLVAFLLFIAIRAILGKKKKPKKTDINPQTLP